MARFTRRIVELSGKSIPQDWLLALERLNRRARGRPKPTFGSIVVHEGPAGPGGTSRTFTGVMTWRTSDGTQVSTRFLAAPVVAGFEDEMAEEDFVRLLQTCCHGAGTPYDPMVT